MGAWHFGDGKWIEDKDLLHGLEIKGRMVVTSNRDRDRGVRFRDLDSDGRCELIVSNDKEQASSPARIAKRAGRSCPSRCRRARRW